MFVLPNGSRGMQKRVADLNGVVVGGIIHFIEHSKSF